MAEEKPKAGAQDRARINVHERYELDYCSRKFNVSHEELKQAVKMVSVMSRDVAEHFAKDVSEA
ncbi:Protein of unknown function [Faunimonas pinastri]|uniref:DUF3606 domain-containing protein n=1 Tax=Faunimonas pinastri TaxID=1855383 RepID=A0A1H9LJI2_9HYPH|nr:DUF3606 domain-containing protein [Faunimonas pinastri]SER11576.1 Protein of unknown function [Faunimonas pinastri]